MGLGSERQAFRSLGATTSELSSELPGTFAPGARPGPLALRATNIRALCAELRPRDSGSDAPHLRALLSPALARSFVQSGDPAF